MSEFSVISPAMFNLYDECELKFYYRYVKQLSAPVSDENFAEGKNIHSLASYFLKGNDISKYESKLNEREKSYWEYLKTNPYFLYEIVGVEQSLSMKIDEFWIGGRLDAVVKQGEDYCILDYKTGGVYSDKTYDYQTMVYLLLCDEFYKKKNSLSFVYLDLKNKKEVCVKFNELLKKDYLERIVSTCKRMKAVSLNKSFCEEISCPYSKICIAKLQ